MDTLATILATAPIIAERPAPGGITDSVVATFDAPGNPEGIVKVEAAGMLPEAEYFAYLVATSTPGLVDCPTVVLRPYAGTLASVMDWRVGPVKWAASHGDYTRVLRSDVVGMAAYDIIIGNADRHPGNFMVTPNGHGHHERLVAIDHGGTFRNRTYSDPLMRLAGQRVPHYIHDHAHRIIAAGPTLMAAASVLGHPAWASLVLSRAEDVTHMVYFPA